MMNHSVIYEVTGRYMDGQKVIAYHLVGEDGSQARANRDRVIYLIGKGQISNMRVQINTDGTSIIRGKGVNLNLLPVYDEAKQRFRDDDISQSAANSKVSVKNSELKDANPMGQFKIIKRVMYKQNCLGYELLSLNGAVTRRSRDDVIKLAIQKLICNAVAEKYYAGKDKTPRIILRGVGCDLGKLPILIVNQQGKIVDPSAEQSDLTVRAAYMKHSGVVRELNTKSTIPFKAGDFIIYNTTGKIEIVNKEDIQKKYIKDTTTDKATCDYYLNNISNYSIEIFGSKPITLTNNMVASWVILKTASKEAKAV